LDSSHQDHDENVGTPVFMQILLLNVIL
jgi:hypothetical protein